MKIKVTVTESRTIEKEITPPYFCKWGDSICKVIDEKTCIIVWQNGDDSKRLYLSPVWLYDKEIAQDQECSEDEFNKAANEALAAISVHVPIFAE